MRDQDDLGGSLSSVEGWGHILKEYERHLRGVLISFSLCPFCAFLPSSGLGEVGKVGEVLSQWASIIYGPFSNNSMTELAALFFPGVLPYLGSIQRAWNTT